MPAEPLAQSTPLLMGWSGFALDIANAAVLQMHLDAAAAGAHVTGRILDLVTERRGSLHLSVRGLAVTGVRRHATSLSIGVARGGSPKGTPNGDNSPPMAELLEPTRSNA